MGQGTNKLNEWIKLTLSTCMGLFDYLALIITFISLNKLARTITYADICLVWV